MKMKSIKTKLFCISFLSIVLTTAIAVTSMYLGNKKIVESIIKPDTQLGMNAITIKTEEMKKSSLETAVLLSQDKNVQASIETADQQMVTDAVDSYLKAINSNAELVTITDSQGNILTGNSISNQQNIKDALNGSSSSYIEPGTESKLSISSYAPVKSPGGQIIGVAVVGYKLDNNKFVDDLKLITGAEITVFLNDMRITTTIMKNGERQVGTKLNETVSKIVLGQKKSYFSEIEILGHPYYTMYEPILNNQGEAIGIFFSGKPLEQIKSSQTGVTLSSLGFILIFSIIVLIISLFITKKIIVTPIDKMSEAAIQLSKGNLHIKDLAHQSNDEIGQLSDSMLHMTDVLQRLLADLRNMAAQHKSGYMSTRIDEAKYEGSFNRVVTGVNQMAEGFSDDYSLLFHCFQSLAEGDFSMKLEELPGEKHVINEMMENVQDHLQDVSRQTNLLLQYALEGDLSHRADVSRHQGDWAKILTGLNHLLIVIAAPIEESTIVLESMALGHFSKKVEGSYKGIFAQIKDSITNTEDSIASYIYEIRQILSDMADNQFDQEITRTYRGNFSDIKTSLNTLTEKLNYVIKTIGDASNHVLYGAKQISNSSMELAHGSTEQTTSILQLGSSIDSIATQVRNNADNAEKANLLVNNSKTNAAVGNQYMKNMLSAMQSIGEASGNISKIMQVIDDIAFQTNILALNAAVEAARAGIHGKGFAVVAEEVRRLAGKSLDASKETNVLIEDAIAKIEEGQRTAKDTANALDLILRDVNEVSSIVENIADDSKNQSAAISEINIGVGQISQVIQTNTAISEETASASQELAGQAETMNQLTSVYRLKA